MNSIGIPTNRISPNTEVSQGPRIGLRHRPDGTGPGPCQYTRGACRPVGSVVFGRPVPPVSSAWPRSGSSMVEV
jgi:hypothetical protein